jgi:hypothetical protein
MAGLKFILNETEAKRAQHWLTHHGCPMPPNQRRLRYLFSQTGIGTACTVICSCGAKRNITDYDSW